MRTFFLLLMLTACGISPATTPVVEADPAPLLEAMSAVQPEPLVELVEHPHTVIGTAEDCPVVTVLESAPDTLREHWQGGCTLESGHEVTGEIERFDGPDGAWIAGNGFRLQLGSDTIFMLDGAIEVSVSGELWLIDAAASVCGTENWACTQGLLGLDLAFSIYPAALFPNDYDTTVSGAMATEDSTFTLDGAWSVDDSTCILEPTRGMLSVQQGLHHALTLNGADNCDGCIGWQVQGQPTPGLCGLNR
jgi:hypothetical protein